MDETATSAVADKDLLVVSGLSAGYGGRTVIAGIDLAVAHGEILGLLGANGSGKSTLVKAITGQLRPQMGTVAIDGINLAREPERAKARFGLAIDVWDLPASLSGWQYLDLVASLRSCASRDWPGGDLTARLGLTQWLERPIEEYSLGTRSKIAVAAALLGSPPLLIFDESLNGLDPVAAWEVKTLLIELAASKRHAIIVSTHVMETVPSLCSRAVFLADGAIAKSWGAEALVASTGEAGGFEARVMQALRNHVALRNVA
ncbi:ABC transporter ATP-binding protein [Mesorhizobium sp. CA13]|uniref:ABC transporter ATP-binding protein n=1 Tax=unclassified Mesorhizobium TaxID=325217 RepID=UPI001129221F|nr:MULTISPECIES: ABC transporter ATP-binding protein [unclassified Mesorhizobium]MBZ9857419.1 ABC transporter ATP-binding protein [Mesorhizobium sp. CA13]MBZ9921839.1 ABC transporter ATP-binding protein [Mesorhizobium sp. BR1-1-7]MBZ9966627.1 ABC transporter ATP-binding protein [Mesorhizobium sp. BR1-1-2]MCA0014788.1 ABC transporter ATP-binding protein [Mesorhizobium sp. B294B1A1]MCA0041091.1 ABC transporter ATP-binding protein [Mesorhizobium sp. B292B1B]